MNATRINILSFGESNTGKSAMIKRYCENRFEKKHIPTIGCDYGTKKIDMQIAPTIMNNKDVNIRVNFWDLSGDIEYIEVRNELYQNIDAAFLVFDITNKVSFDALDDWLLELQKYGIDGKKTLRRNGKN